MAFAESKSTSLQLVLANEIFEILQQARSDATLHVNALDARGNPVKLQCSLDANGQLSLDFEGASADSMFQISDYRTTSCVVKSVVHPVYMVMNYTAPHANLTVTTAEERTVLTQPLPVNTSSAVHSDIGDFSDSQLTETDNVVMHLDDIGATNIVLQYSDIVEETGEMVLTSLTDRCYEIADI